MSSAGQTPDPKKTEAPLSPHTEQALRSLGIAPSSESDAMAPVDLRAIPREDWPDYECAPLLLPVDIANYIVGLEEMTRLEQESIEDRLVDFYQLGDLWTVSWQAGQFRLQRA